MRLICFKHVPFEGPAAVTDWAQARGHKLDCVEVYAGEPIPAPREFDLLFVMGGPMNIYEESKFPWLREEQKAIHRAIEEGKGLVGVCLGAQLIADQLGGPVTRAEKAEIGWFPVKRAKDCPAELPLPEELVAYHWHGDRLAIPPGARHILQSAGCLEQGFLFESRILGLQCHLETNPAALAALIDACRSEITNGPCIQSAARMQAEPLQTYTSMHAVLFELLDHLASNCLRHA